MKPEIERIKRLVESGSAESEARQVIRAIGDSFRPSGYKYEGSMLVHMYQGILTAKETRTFISQLTVGNADEAMADLAIKELAKAAKDAYGRKESATRK